MLRIEIIFLFLLVLIFVPLIVSADPIGMPVPVCYEITNINDFPDYTLILYPSLTGTTPFGVVNFYTKVNQGDCISTDSPDAMLFAAKNSDFNDTILEYLMQQTNVTEQARYLESYPHISAAGFQSNTIFPEGSNIANVTVLMKITSLSKDNFQIQKFNIIYTFIDGSSENEPFVNQSVWPQPPQKDILPVWFSELWYVLIPVIALAGIVLVILFRKYRK